MTLPQRFCLASGQIPAPERSTIDCKSLLVNEGSAAARKNIAVATFSGCPMRPSNAHSEALFLRCSGQAVIQSVEIMPGATGFARPWWACGNNSGASLSPSAMRAGIIETTTNGVGTCFNRCAGEASQSYSVLTECWLFALRLHRGYGRLKFNRIIGVVGITGASPR